MILLCMLSDAVTWVCCCEWGSCVVIISFTYFSSGYCHLLNDLQSVRLFALFCTLVTLSMMTTFICVVATFIVYYNVFIMLYNCIHLMLSNANSHKT